MEVDLAGRSLAAQLKHADRLRAKLAVLAGPDEYAQNMISMRNLASGDQQVVPVEDLEQTITQELM